MRFGNFSVHVPESVERHSGYLALPHGTQYTIKLLSHDYRRCDAEVRIDGKPVGTFRLNGSGSVVLQRGTDDAGRFTFYARNTPEEIRAGGNSVGEDVAGLVQVKFTPELRPSAPVSVVPTKSSGGGPSGQSSSYGDTYRSSAAGFAPSGLGMERTPAGITGLSGRSTQTFETASPLNYDYAAEVTISLRLVADAAAHDHGPRPLLPVGGTGNPVPSPV